MMWKIIEGANSHLFDFRIENSRGLCVAFCDEENAPLLSAAPDLLDALESLVAVAKKSKSPTFSIPGEPSYLIEESERKNAKDWLLNTKNWLPQAEAALSKAKGETP